ncbi:MAG: competence/damage-inducible protein A [Firmicutes bacterium]|nr:competence/damage-inducible protein A [Bacillota bacterium]
MRAELIMVGTELLLGEIVDTNGPFMARHLADLGIDVYFKSTVGDNLSRLQEVLKKAFGRSDLILISGGLGPTEDDLTREAVSLAAGCPLREDPEVIRWIENRFVERYGSLTAMSPQNRKQALFPAGSEIIPNPVGTAPGFWLEKAGRIVVALPGVARELEAMFRETILPKLRTVAGEEALVIRNLHFAGIGESSLAELLADLVSAQTNPTIALYASGGTVRVRLAAKTAQRAKAWDLIAPLEAEIKRRAGAYFYGVDEQSLEEVVAKGFLERGLTLALAESCTGGLIAHRITNIPGSSDFFLRGYVVYTNQAKIDDLGVRPATLAAFTAYSAEVAREMAEGVRKRAQTDFGLAVTGIAGPGGGTPDKPVGLAYIALASAENTTVQKHFWRGTREQVKERLATAALQLLWRTLSGLQAD